MGHRLYPNPSAFWRGSDTRIAVVFDQDRAGHEAVRIESAAGEPVDDLARAIAEHGTVEAAIAKLRTPDLADERDRYKAALDRLLGVNVANADELAAIRKVMVVVGFGTEDPSAQNAINAVDILLNQPRPDHATVDNGGAHAG